MPKKTAPSKNSVRRPIRDSRIANVPKAQPLLALCVIFRDNVGVIDELLKSVLDGAPFDEFVFVDTGSVDGTRAKVEAFLRARGSSANKLLDFVWADDFSAARQFSFEAATAKWRMFLDTDDKLVGGNKLRQIIASVDKSAPQIKGLFVPYSYAWDENLLTMRVCRWVPADAIAAGAVQWQWADKIHERLELGGDGLARDALGTIDPADVNVLHKDKSPEEKQAALVRNGVIAAREYAATDDPRYRARLARTIAMEFKSQDRGDLAIPYLEELWSLYPFYPEGKQGAADLSGIHITNAWRGRDETEGPRPEHIARAMPWAKRAGPSYEALAHHAARNFEECIRAAHRGQAIPQQTTHEGLIAEKGGAPFAAAESLLMLKAPFAADRAEQIMSSVPAKIRSHPMLVGHAMRVRTTIDRITIVVPGTPQPFDENGGAGMLGGSEEAVMYLSRALAGRGRNVRIFTDLPLHRLPGQDKYGVDWQPMRAFGLDGEHGALVVWRSLQFLDSVLRERMKRGSGFPGITSSWLWMHDGQLGAPPDVVAGLTGAVDGTIVLSAFHARQIASQGGQKLVLLANGIVRGDFESDIGEWSKDRFSVIYSSCPSRGLLPLLAMWPTVKHEVPQARLDIYYDWSGVQQAQPELYEKLMVELEKVQDLDVVHHGGVDHATLNAALKRCNVWAYSHFENPNVETFCISAVKASACGATVLTVPNGAVPEVAPNSVFCMDPVEYCQALVGLLKEPMGMQERIDNARLALETFSWDTVAQRFSNVWSLKSIRNQVHAASVAAEPAVADAEPPRDVGTEPASVAASV